MEREYNEDMNLLQLENLYLDLPPVLSESDTVSLDLELGGLNENQLHRPAGWFLSLACSFDGKNAYLIQDEAKIQSFLANISKATWVFHNSTFDIRHLNRWAEIDERSNMRDTMLIEKLMFSEYYSDFGLNDLVRRYLGCYMEKETRKEFSTHQGSMTPEQLHYSALDVIGTWLVDQEQQKIIEKQEKILWERLENPMVWVTVSLDGYPMDVQKWNSIAEGHEKIVLDLEQRLGEKYGKNISKMVGRGKNKIEVEEFVNFNPASPSQVLRVLREEYFEDVESTGDDILSDIVENGKSEQSKSFAKDMLDYRSASKKVSTYGKTYSQNYVEADGKIYPELKVYGAATGRFSCGSPNLQQIPRQREYRECFIAGDGRKLIIADYSSQEPRIFAEICQDKKLIEIFNSGKDIYCEVALQAFAEQITKKDKERRNQVKALVLGLIYGLTPYGFSRDNNVSLEVAEEMYEKFFEAFPEAAKWVKTQQQFNKGFTRTLLGRKCHLHPYAREWKNNALNNPMQGGGADMTKLALKQFRARYKEEMKNSQCGIILSVHDEIIIWAVEERAEYFQKALESVMVEVAEKIHPHVPAIAECHIADSWAEK